MTRAELRERTKIRLSKKTRMHLFQALSGITGDSAMASKCLDNKRNEQAQAQICGMIIRFQEFVSDPVLLRFIEDYAPGSEIDSEPTECSDPKHNPGGEHCPDCN